MADIDFETDLRGGFQISLSDNPKSVKGNRALLNRFELTFLTARRRYLLGNNAVTDTYGGDAEKFVSVPRVLNDTQSISASLSIAIDQTIKSIQEDETANIPDTEKLQGAELVTLDIVSDIVTATIRVHPVELESFEALEFNLPVTRR
jgi:hypothetical protein